MQAAPLAALDLSAKHSSGQAETDQAHLHATGRARRSHGLSQERATRLAGIDQLIDAAINAIRADPPQCHRDRGETVGCCVQPVVAWSASGCPAGAVRSAARWRSQPGTPPCATIWLEMR